MRAAVEGRDTLALMPTGSGKSLTYQLAAMLRPEPTLVLSPLIALMKDQVDKLPPGLRRPRLSSTRRCRRSRRPSVAAVPAGETRLLYAAPERLGSALRRAARGSGIGLVVVDEVHCVSMWGHDFRPDYLFIRHGLEALGEPALLGMTATATPDDGTRDRRARSAARSRWCHQRHAAEPPLRRRGGRERGRPGRDPRRAAASSPRRVGDRVRPIAALDGGARARPSREASARSTTTRDSRPTNEHAPGRLRRGPHPGRRRDDGVRHGHRQAGRSPGLPRQLSGLGREYVQMVGRAGRDGEPSETLLLAGPSDASALRRFARRGRTRRGRAARGLPRTSVRRTASSIPRSSLRSSRNATRACSSGCSSRPAS